jgi:hypothetical protein
LPLITDPSGGAWYEKARKHLSHQCQILNVKNTADQPVILPTKFQFVINPATAKMLGRVEHPARPRR